MPRLSKIGAACLAAFGWTGISTVSASYLVVAGGGGSGGGGGGAGGLLTSSASLNPTLSYTVTVGAGGAGVQCVGGGSSGIAGSNSSVSTINITSVGGGFGGGGVNGGAGGSGGGAGSSGSSVGGGTGTSGQGNNGGSNGAITSSPYPAGGGGGAGAVGGNATSTTQAGNGGNGTASSISGTSVTYAGGGGGGYYTTGGTATTGGTGGGGAGNSNTGNAVSGTANLGGGGGGTGTIYFGGKGGSGIVIISYLAPQQFSGGVVTTSGGNVIHTFTTSGTLGPITTISASYLIVAGGGGGTGIGGGGGAGGLLTSTGLTIDPSSTYVVTVGAGGAGAANNVYTSDGTTGSNSIFSAVVTTALGGGGGGRASPATAGLTGGSAGGSGGNDSASQTAATAGTSGQGNAGGASCSNGTGGGGGGGAGAAGVSGTTSGRIAGAGGIGVASSISGTSTYYAGGGGGGANQSTGGAGGTGGGGAGTGSNSTAGSGTANTGGGGGGAGASDPPFLVGTSGAGGSGIVIISYAGATQLMAGGTVTISGGNVIHTFTSSGYLTPITLVNRSLRFRSSASAYLNRTPATASNRTTWSWSGWVKRGKLGAYQTLFSTYGNSTNIDEQIRLYNSDVLNIEYYSTSSFVYQLLTTPVYRDPAAWYHIVVAMDTTQATASNRIKIYVNGTQVTSFSTATYPAQNTNTLVDGALPHYIGVDANNGLNAYYDGYMTEINFIDGQALTPNSFGTFNSYGVWQPITYGGSYGTNGFYLPFTNTTSATTLAYDFSPQGNNWTPNNISVSAGSTYDSMTDVPTLTSATAANYATLNPLINGWWASSTGTITDGNLKVSGVDKTGFSTIDVSTCKCYFEVTITSAGTAGAANYVLITAYVRATFAVEYTDTGQKRLNGGTATAYGSSWTTGDVIGVAVDASTNSVTFYKNNVSQGAITNTFPSGQAVLGGFYGYSTSGTPTATVNFGQQPFTYTAPSGFVALNTYNL